MAQLMRTSNPALGRDACRTAFNFNGLNSTAGRSPYNSRNLQMTSLNSVSLLVGFPSGSR